MVFKPILYLCPSTPLPCVIFARTFLHVTIFAHDETLTHKCKMLMYPNVINY